LAEPAATPGPLARRFRSAVVAALECPRTDGELLTRFVTTRDERAFTELVRRLGPTVFGVCRRFLGNTSDAEDAFQVTFLVLARKADTVRPPGRVAGWVHGVATLAARKAHATRARRLARETAVGTPPERPVSEVVVAPDLGPVLDDELARLPDKFRLPIVLCELRERTTAQAAAELGWPVGTVASRLSRGRALLADRLTRRGVTTGAVLAAGTLVRSATAAVSERLIESTVSAAVTGCTPGSAAVLSLTREVVRAMSVSKLRLVVFGLVASGAVALVGGGVVTPHTFAAPVPAKEAKEPDPVERVKLSDVSGLLRQESIRKDVGMSDKDYETLAAFKKEKTAEIQKRMEESMRAQLQAQVAGGPGRGPVQLKMNSSQFTELTDEAVAEFDKMAFSLLKPEQARRLKQIGLQARGPAALLDRRVIRGLRLTAGQEDAIDAVLPKRPGVLSADQYEKTAEATEACWKTALQVLTAEQRMGWDALVGKPIPTVDLLKANPLSDESLADRIGGGAFKFNTGGLIPGGIGGAGGGIVLSPKKDDKE
jgi:RNA polymerase sigma-70 factor (ECF subfamily)